MTHGKTKAQLEDLRARTRPRVTISIERGYSPVSYDRKGAVMEFVTVGKTIKKITVEREHAIEHWIEDLYACHLMSTNSTNYDAESPPGAPG